ncbi:hypothetical protein BDZ88DRAFT_151849 [Geranomyces variabilis]|nr:hypothetical protein BDZ88DRAFT_151849 [Geranomyces variabilis]
MVEDPPRSRSPPRPPRRSGPPAARGRSISPRSRSRSRSRGSRSPYSSRSRSTGSSYTGSSRSRSTGSRSSRSRSRSWSSRSRSRSVSRSRSRSRGRGKAPTGAADPNNKRIFITPISKNVTPAHLREIFGLFGKVVDVAVPPAPPPRLPGPPLVALSGGQLNAGIALVTFEKREDAEAAITGMNEGWIDGCLLRVAFAEPQHERRAAEALARARGDLPHKNRSPSPRGPKDRRGMYRDRSREAVRRTGGGGGGRAYYRDDRRYPADDRGGRRDFDDRRRRPSLDRRPRGYLARRRSRSRSRSLSRSRSRTRSPRRR